MNTADSVKLFGLTNISIEYELRRIQKDIGVEFGHGEITEGEIEEVYYPQFSVGVRAEASRMAVHYQLFYCLENSIREIISERLQEAHGPEWWNSAVPPNVRESAKKNQERESASGVTPRSERAIDYITFGELGEILKVNWDLFSDTFKNKLAVERILSSLNLLRGPIAHCKSLAEDEVERLQLSVRDWFRQMS